MKPEKQLYQWDVNQYLTGINPAAQYVDYPIGDEVIRLETDGTRCRIPDEVLQTYGGKTCYERYPDGTYRAYSFTVLYAPKPPDYVFTPEERTTFEALTARVDAAIDEIKRRADSGEFTPVKGVDYFTDAEKDEMMESVSSGAVGEFRKVVDTATTEYNVNHTEKITAYDTNATDKLSTYNSNAEQKLEAYNQNHTTKLTTYDTNAEQHTTDYNRNAEQKLEAYNQNHTEKVAEYNQNAETKTSEFDSNAAALQTEVDRLRGECDTLAAEKANVDGYYEEMTVGDAEQLIATQFVEDNEPYLFRPTGGPSDVGNRAYLDKIVGGTVAWNQLIASGYAAERSIVLNTSYVGISSHSVHNKIANHKYLVKCRAKVDVETSLPFQLLLSDNRLETITSSNFNLTTEYAIVSAILTAKYNYSTFLTEIRTNREYDESVTLYAKECQVFDITQMFGSTIADYIYSIEQSQSGAGVAWFKKLFPNDYYAYNAGELLSVEGLQSHDTVGFNQWDEEWEVGDISTSTGEDATATNRIRSKGFMPCLPNVQYCFTASDGSLGTALLPFFYGADKQFISVGSWSNVQNVQTTPQNCHYMRFKESTTYGTTYNHDICINLSNPSRNGEYEPYEKHSYPLDNSLTLRGIPKLDASNNLYYDGDEYASDGKVKRKYGVVDLGTLTWETDASNRFRAQLSGIKNPTTASERQDGLVCARYSPSSSVSLTDMTDKSMLKYSGEIFIKDTAYTDAHTFKTAMSGVQLCYELATPTTETAEPFQHIQIVDDFGTEEFVSTGIVPVGHKTRYPANLRDKLQHLPDLASADGTYLIQQSGKQMSLIHMPAVFPETPTEDGTYTLKTVVTGGVATLQWVVE